MWGQPQSPLAEGEGVRAWGEGEFRRESRGADPCSEWNRMSPAVLGGGRRVRRGPARSHRAARRATVRSRPASAGGEAEAQGKSLAQVPHGDANSELVLVEALEGSVRRLSPPPNTPPAPIPGCRGLAWGFQSPPRSPVRRSIIPPIMRTQRLRDV